ncbi:Holliday junction resolvase RuvX [Candidatus Saganbacteria bacterium]|nr:Holliday junction resolvase RuvX [Candidatus Saganbacteria bacterium]
MRVLGIDYGEKRLGIALSDPLGLMAHPLTFISKNKTVEADARAIKHIIEEYSEVEKIVVGLPKTMKGEIGQAAQKVLAFVAALKGFFPQEIITWDERLTTASVTKTLIKADVSREKRRQNVDKLAAAVMLQSYLDRRR